MILDTAQESATTGTISAGTSLAFDAVTQSIDGAPVRITIEFQPIASLSLVIDFIEASQLEAGIKNSLLQKLAAIRQRLDSGDKRNVTGQLGAVVNELSALRSKKVSDEMANALIAWIGDLMEQFAQR